MAGEEDQEPADDQAQEVTEQVASKAHSSDARRERKNILEGVAQYTAMAQSLKQKGLLARATRMMERAVVLCMGRESDHPTMALEAARARINLAAYLSEGHRISEAMETIATAQKGLGQILAWASGCDPNDDLVAQFEQQARALRAATLVAEAMLREEAGEEVTADMFDDEVVDEARQTASDLGMRHPLSTMLAGAIGTALTQAARKGVPRGASSPSSMSMQLAASRQIPPDSPAGAEAQAESETAASRMPSHGKDTESPSNPKEQARARGGQAEGPTDVFSQFLRDREAARVAHLLALSDDWEQQTKKKLQQVHRTTQLQIEATPEEVVDELKEKRYTRTGHKLAMQAMVKSNRSWSDPSLNREARREKAAPEVHLLRKLNKKLHVKPPPPPPPPPKPKIDASLAGSLGKGAAAASAATKAAEEGKNAF
eukprot:TRINITY_DN48674_c0_g1_i1.p1 TRINITY_DN48674_c0_g1~~TRINITY_DN48674_c0_g1_i1.p1  ORF type:complete len:430 (-),score=109.03 TRINITY_DN48674_c0_g1_i1:159-1448(-)